MTQEVMREDYEFLRKLDGLQKAFVYSLAAPLCVREAWQGCDFDIGFPGMYYDCVNDTRTSGEVIEKRVRLARKDIEMHYGINKNLMNLFLDLDGYMLASSEESTNRREFADIVGEIKDLSVSYVEMVRGYKGILKDNSFLEYPYFNGNVFSIPGFSEVSSSFFNNSRSYEGFFNSMSDLFRYLDSFRMWWDKKIPIINKQWGEETGAGFFDYNFRKLYSHSQGMFKEFGLNI